MTERDLHAIAGGAMFCFLAMWAALCSWPYIQAKRAVRPPDATLH